MAAFFSCGNTFNYMGLSKPSPGLAASTALAKPLALRLYHCNLEHFHCYYDSIHNSRPKGRGRCRAVPIFAIPPPNVSATPSYPNADKLEKEDSFIRTSTSTSSSGWAEFAERVAGEWDGFGADFTVEGSPIELPESVVPEAYREWEVKVFDWQTQCPTLADDHSGHRGSFSPSFLYKTIKLLPTVGCEADAATRYSIQERHITSSSSTTKFAYQSSGCYVALWPTDDGKLLELEHSLIDPRDKESRVRIIQVLKYHSNDDNDGVPIRLQSVKVFVEQWYGPFRNGEQLGGCAIRDSAFASTQPLDASQVAGAWQGLHAVAKDFQTSSTQQLVGVPGDDECQLHRTIRNEDNLILLPKQLWCLLKHGGAGTTYCEAGWLLEPGCAITSKCTFSSTAELQEIATATETLSPI